ncbi:hemagglutinin repeat-containing protein [Acinetobacter sp. YH12243]|nr:hemagglutinin repeat-containing protein [Acinetobacter sp. YH12243]
MKVTAVGLAGIEALAPGLKAPKITIGESSSTRTEQRTQTGTDLGANNVYVGSAGQTTLTSSNIDAQNTVLAGKKVTLDAAEEQHKTVTSNSKETVQGLGVKLNKDSIRVGGFVLEDAENTVKTTATTHKSGNINTENLTIQGAEGVDILGQNITATGDTIIDHGRGNLNIGGYENKTTTEEKTHTETISTEVGIRNAYLDAILAVEAVADATKALSKAKDDYSQAQRDYAAGRITKGALDDSKANVAMATANVASAQIAVGAAAASAAASSATYGFTIGANGERIETTTTTNTEQSQWQGSNLDLNNLQLKSEGQDINIQGSRVNATGTTTFDGSKDLNVTAGVEHSKQDSNSKTNSQSVSYTYGGGGSASIGKQTSQSQNESLTHVNSEVVLNRTEGAIDKLNIQGGEVSIADRGNLQVNQIHVESLQDTETSSNSSKGGNIGLGFGSNGKASNISAGYNQSKGSIDSAWVNDTSKLLIGNAQNDADLDAMGVKNITSIGGVIANATKNEDGTLTDHGKLNYSGELALKDIEDHNYNSSSGFNVSTTIGKTTNNKDGEKSKYPNGSTTIGLNSSGQETEQLTKATMGQGTVANASDSTNRDINNTQEITRDQVTGMLDGSVTVDQRLLSKSGRAEIIQEQKELPENFRQSAENIVKQMPEGEYKEKALQSLNNIQAKLYSLPADFEGLEEYGQQVAGELLKNGLEIKEVEKIIDTDNYWYAIQKLSAVQEQLDILSQNGSGIEQILNSELSKEQPIVNSNSLISILAENTDSSLAVKETDLLGFKFLHAAAEISKNIEKISVDSGVDIEKIQLAASVLLGGPVKATAGYIVNQFSGEYIDYATNAVSDHLVKSLYGLSDGLYDDWSRSEKISELKQLGLSDDDFQRSLNYAESLQNAKLGATFIVGIAAETLISGKGKAKNSDEISVKPTVPDYVTRNDHDFSATENYKGKPKAYINDKGDLVAANPEGTGSVQSHIRGGNSENTPYISTSDPAIAIDSKNYGGEQIKIDTKRLQEDIDAGKISGSQIVTHTEVRKELQSKVDAAQAKYDRNPSKKNRDKLRDANKDLNHAIRDGECLIKGCVPSEYIKK